MTYRYATSRDIGTLTLLEHAHFSCSDFALSRQMIAYHIRRNTVYVACEDEHIVGYILLQVRKAYLKIYSLLVAQSHQGRGIAQSLLEYAYTQAKKRHKSYIVLEVRSDNTKAIALYTKNNFEQYKVIEHFYGDGCSAWVMRRVLN